MSKKTVTTQEELLQEALVPVEEQPYEIPAHWQWVSGKSVANWGSGGTPSRKITEYYTGKIPWIKTGEVRDQVIYSSEECISEEALKKSSAKLFPVGSVVIAMYGATIGRTAILGIEATTNQACAVGIPMDNVSNRYLFHYYRSQKSNFVNLGKGGAQPNISQSLIKDYPVPLPPLNEQKRISDKVEQLLGKINKAKQLIEEAKQTFELRRAAIMDKAFHGELTKKWREEQGLSSSWDSLKLNDACLKITDGTHHSPISFSTGKYMYITAKNIKEEGILLDKVTYVDKDVHDEIYRRCDVKQGDLLYIKDGATTGVATINTLKDEFSLLSSVAVLRVNSSVLIVRYLYYLLNSPIQKSDMLGQMSGNAIRRLTLKKIKDTKIKIPSVEEQSKIVEILDNYFSLEKKVESILFNIPNMDIISESILSKAFKGELGTSDPNDELVLDELLNNIKSI